MSYALPAGQCYWKFRILLSSFHNDREIEGYYSGNNLVLISTIYVESFLSRTNF